MLGDLTMFLVNICCVRITHVAFSNWWSRGIGFLLNSDLQKYCNSGEDPTKSRKEILTLFLTFLFSERKKYFLERQMSKHNWGKKPFPVEKPV